MATSDGHHLAIFHIQVGTRCTVHQPVVCFLYGFRHLADPFPM